MSARASRIARWIMTSAAATAAALVACATPPAAVPPAPVAGEVPEVTAPRAWSPGEPATVVLPSRDLGSGRLAAVLQSVGTTARVLMIGAHPDDEDTNLIAWLARGRHVETAYLSLTRGDGGQNLIGNELGDNLGIIRTQELEAARRLDGGRQYFTRAFDFGFSRNADETFQAWPRDTVLADVVRVVRAFRPHVIIAVFSGTPRDGHGHHQASGQLAREAWDLAADTARFPVYTHGLAWDVPKFYRASRFAPDEMTMRVNVGEFDAIAGRSYAEIAADSRSQHRSQGFGALQRRGALWDYLQREAVRVPAPVDARGEQSLFDGVDTSWVALVDQVRATPGGNAAATWLAEADVLVRAARDGYRPSTPDALGPPLARALDLVRRARDAIGVRPPRLQADQPGFTARLVDARDVALVTRRADTDGREVPVYLPPGAHAEPALWDALTLTEARLAEALVLAAGVAVEAAAPRRLLPAAEPRKRDVPDTLSVDISVFNRGRAAVRLAGAGVGRADTSQLAGGVSLAADSSHRVRRVARTPYLTMPWWRVAGREQAMFRAAIDGQTDAERNRQHELAALVRVVIHDVPVDVRVPVVYRYADPVEGDVQVPVAVVPGISIGHERVVDYLRADADVERRLRVAVLSSYPSPQPVSVRLLLPDGLVADSAVRDRVLEPDVMLTLTFTVRGRLPEGMHEVRAIAEHLGQSAQAGYYTISYPHIPPQRSYGGSLMYLSTVPVTLRPNVRVGYIAGVSDDGIAALRALDVPVEELAADRVASADLSRYTTIVIGPRAYQVSDALRAANPRLFAWAQAGGTLVVQYGQFEMAEPGLMPFPVRFTRPAARVTDETAAVRALDAESPLLRVPNRIGDRDWEGWVQERALYMPSTVDPRYRTVIGMRDPDEPENPAGILAAPVGRGLYVYTSLALFRQWPAGVPGGARLLVNLVSARGADFAPR
jgi:LmbE family N-acetylglucosaminyl deacetylase